MVGCVARAVEGAKGGAFCYEYLSIFDVYLGTPGLMLVYLGLRAACEKILYTPYMIWVPMGQENFRDNCRLHLKKGREEARPVGLALACINEQSLRAFADEIGVCPFERLAAQVAKIKHHHLVV